MATNNEIKKSYLSPSHNSSINRSKSPKKAASSFRYSRNDDTAYDDLVRVSSDEESDFNSTGPKSNISKTSNEHKNSLRNRSMRMDYSQDYSNHLNLEASAKLGKSRENYLNEITEESQNSDNEISDNSDLEKDCSDEGVNYEYKPKKSSGIQWSNIPETLEDLVIEFKNQKQINSQIIKAVCCRNDCKCAFKNGEPLLLFPMMDTYVAYTTWELATSSSSSFANANTKSSTNRQLIGNNSNSVNSIMKADSDCQAKLMLFKQCRGWYEILNESNVAVPYYTSVDQIKRSRPSSFITRENIKVLIAPKSLHIPKGKISPDLLQYAQSSEIIAESQPAIIKSGTIFKYIDYFPNCKFVRGKKIKYINLIFVIEKIPGSLDPESEDYQRFVYIGTEEASRESYFPTRVSLSIVAGPENISGVHTIGGILRKFRLPVSVRPVAVCSNTASNAYRDGQVELPIMPGLTVTDKHFMRIRSIHYGDLFILASINNPERLYIITTKMLPDHNFYRGSTLDKKYIELTRHHSLHVSEFLSNGHNYSSMEYLLKHLQKSKYPVKSCKNSYNSNSTKEDVERIYAATGHDPRVGPECNMTPSQVDEVYDELDDIYFFIRNGYYPPKKTSYSLRSREAISVNGDGHEQTFNGLHRDLQKTPNSSQKLQNFGVRRADELLAESLNINTKDPNEI